MQKSLALGIVLITTFIVFMPSLFGEFLAFDDELLILDNPTIHDLSLSNIKQAFTTYDPELYIPLTLLTHQIEWAIAGDNPLLYHVTNLLIHLSSAALVFLILQRFFSLRICIICTLLFSLHPLQVESVAWVSGRKDLLASVFFLASTHTYLKWKESSEKKITSILLFICGLLSKVSIFPLPFSLLLLDYLKGEKLSRKHITEKLPYFLLAAIFLIIAFAGKHTQASDPVTALTLSPVSVLLSIQHTVFPFGLSIFYPFISEVSWANPQVFFSLIILLALTTLCIFSLKRTFLVVFAVFWFGLLIIPSLLNMQRGGDLGVPDLYLTSDRYAYLAIIGPIILFGYVLKKTTWHIGLIIVLMFSVVSLKQVSYWHNSDKLFRRVIDTNQPSHVAYTNIGGFSAQEGEFKEAEILFTKSLSIRRTTRALFNLAQIKAHLGKNIEAIALFRELLILSPNDNQALKKLNNLL